MRELVAVVNWWSVRLAPPPKPVPNVSRDSGRLLLSGKGQRLGVLYPVSPQGESKSRAVARRHVGR